MTESKGAYAEEQLFKTSDCKSHVVMHKSAADPNEKVDGDIHYQL